MNTTPCVYIYVQHQTNLRYYDNETSNGGKALAAVIAMKTPGQDCGEVQ